MHNSATTNQLPGPPHFVDLHVNPGESVSIQFFDGNETILRGPTTIKMISQHAYPPMPMPVQVPPGHMIQQIVDEHGTLRHIILSALNGANGQNGTTYTNSPNYGPQQSPPNSSYCCCCYNTCSSGSTTPQNSMASSVSSPQVPQPHLSHNPIFPLSSHSFARPRRSNRTYSSPNGKRLSNYNSPSNPYYNTSPVNKVTSSRYSSSKSDNLKSNHFNRHSTSLHFEPTRPYDSSSETKYYINKTYDYSYNSSNASQASTLDQMNENLKYYKEDNFCIEDDYAKKSFDANIANSTKESNYFLGFNQQPNLTSDQESHKSSQSECTDLNQDASLSCENFDVNFNQLNNSDFVSRPDDQVINTKCEQFSEKNEDSVHENKTSESCSADVQLAEFPIPETNSGMDATEPNAQDDVVQMPNQIKTNETQTENKSCDLNASCETSQRKVDKIKPLVNGHVREPFQLTGTPTFVISPERNESEKSDSDEQEEEEGDDEDEGEPPEESSVTYQRSPRHLLPKQEVISLAVLSVASTSIRLKWFFIQPNDHTEHKKHFVVDMIQDNVDDSPNSRTVYQGHTTNCRVFHLQPQKEYTFRVRTSTESALLVSNLLTVVTAEQQTSVGAKACGRRGKQSMQQQLMQQQQQIFQQQQLLMQQQQQLVEVRQEHSRHWNLFVPHRINTGNIWPKVMVLGVTAIGILLAVLIHHQLYFDSQP